MTVSSIRSQFFSKADSTERPRSNVGSKLFLLRYFQGWECHHRSSCVGGLFYHVARADASSSIIPSRRSAGPALLFKHSRVTLNL